MLLLLAAVVQESSETCGTDTFQKERLYPRQKITFLALMWIRLGIQIIEFQSFADRESLSLLEKPGMRFAKETFPP